MSSNFAPRLRFAKDAADLFGPWSDPARHRHGCHNLFNRFDATRKEKALRRNQGEIAAGSVRPLPPELAEPAVSVLAHMAAGGAREQL